MAIAVSHFLQDQQIIRHPDNPKQPLVSVCMPTYRLRPMEANQRAIESVLGQTFSDFEFIIVDDGSLDGLCSLILEYQKRDPRIVLIRHEINSGLPGLRVDEALMIAQGKYIAYMFEDDEWYPHALEALVSTAQKGPEECAVYGAVDWIMHHADGQVENKILGAWDFNYGLLKNTNYMANCAVLHPRSVLGLCGMYDPHILIRRHCDYDLWLRMGRQIPFRRCNQVIGKVTSGTTDALGSIVDQDFVLTFRFLQTERDAALTSDALPSYLVDSLDMLSMPEEKHRVQERYIIPFWQQHPRILTAEERKQILASSSHPHRLLVTKGDYSTSVDVTLRNFSRLLSNSTLSFNYIQEKNLSVLRQWDYDTLVLYRTIGHSSLNALTQAHLWKKPVVYLMDDNMFKFGTGYLEAEFSYLKPNSVGYQTLSEEVSEADLVISYSPIITRDSQAHNPRTIELFTNIQATHIVDAEPMGGGKETGRRLKYAILTGSARKEELAALWETFQEFGRRHKEEVEFHVWGIDPSKFGDLLCPVFYKEFNHSYDAYLQALREEKFDYVLCPLFDDHESKLSKSPIKYLEATAAGAVGIYSDVVVYQCVQTNVSGLRVANQPQAWLDMLEHSFQKTDLERNQMFFAAKSHILKELTSEAQLLKFLSAFEAARLHEGLHSSKTSNGRAVIAYFFHEALLGGATLHLMQHAVMLRQYGFQPLLCFLPGPRLSPDILEFAKRYDFPIEQLDFRYYVFPLKLDYDERQAIPRIKKWMSDHQVRFVHTVTYMPEILQAAHELGVPSLTTLHQYYDNYFDAPPEYSPITAEDEKMVSAVHSSSLRYAEKWQSALDVPAFCIRAPISASYFEEYANRRLRKIPEVPTLLISGTLQPRKGQLKAIRAVAILRSRGISVKLILLGYDHLFFDYVEECRQAIQRLGVQDLVTIPGFSSSPQPFYNEADYIFCSSDDESMPQSILKAMASGIRVISTPAGGVKELVADGFSGVVTQGFEAEHLADGIERALHLSEEHWDIMLENAHLAAQMSCSHEVVANKLLGLYNLAVRERAKQFMPPEPTQSVFLSKSRRTQFIRQLNKRWNIFKTRFLVRLSYLGRILEFLTLLIDHRNLENEISPAFQQLREDSYHFIPLLKGHVLQPSKPLNHISFVEYQYEFKRAHLRSVSISPIWNASRITGNLGIEIVSPEGKIAIQAVYPLARLDIQKPVEFSFEPIPGTDTGIWLVRVFVRDSNTAVKIYEWKKAMFPQKSLVSRKGFMGFTFEEPLSPSQN